MAQTDFDSTVVLSDDEELRSETSSQMKLNYVISNLERVGASTRLELFDWDQDIDLLDDTCVADLDLDLDLDTDETSCLMEDTDDNDDHQHMDAKNAGEIDIKKKLNEQKLNQLVMSSKKRIAVKDLSLEQINGLIQSFSSELRQINSGARTESYFAEVYHDFGYLGIVDKIKLSMFTNEQKYYIIGCLHGLFPEYPFVGQQIYGILFPETLVRILMKWKSIDYEMALNLIKSNSKSL